MPHIRLTVSANASPEADFERLLPELVDLLTRFETIEPRAIKAYADLRPYWAMGEGAPSGFVHCEVCLLQGRDEPLRARISEAFRDHLHGHFHRLVEMRDVGVTVEVREMDAASYRKASKP